MILLKWLSMGGYGIYIWPAYAVVSTGLILIFFSVKSHQKRMRQKLHQWFQRS